ncbi:MAG: DUF58 domain-containing protein [Planctomycetota bacterium]|nr:DUF58 domain-containing protein [Planctomycetota bacterium]MDA1139319.1 DUF58 domain-containing protein [Planctomycetota bacterium]
MNQAQLLTSSAVARIKQLEIFARKRIDGYLKGANRSRAKGISTEFMQHREYQHGDDLRHLDWKVFARTDRLVTRVFEEFTNLDAILVVDFSGSMEFGERPMSKVEFALHCSAMLGYLCFLGQNRFGLASCAESITDFLPPKMGNRHLAEFYRKLVEMNVRGETDLKGCAMSLTNHVRRRSLIIAISDCYEDPEALTHALGQLVLRGHDVILYQIVHEDEQELTQTSFTLYRDMETGQMDGADPLEIRDAYRDVAFEHGRKLSDGATRLGIEYHQLTVTEDWDRVLALLLHKRARS